MERKMAIAIGRGSSLKLFRVIFFTRRVGKSTKGGIRHRLTLTHQTTIDRMAATAEPMDDEFAVAGPLPLSRLEVKLSLSGTSLMTREMESLPEISRNSLKLVIILLKVLPIRNFNNQ
jgi:hypothetical protein